VSASALGGETSRIFWQSHNGRPEQVKKGAYMPFCSSCGNEVKRDSNFCAQCGERLVLPHSSLKPQPSGPGQPSIIDQLRALGVRTKMLLEVSETPQTGETVLGEMARSFKERLVFTNFRLISSSPIPDSLRPFELDGRGGKVRMGGSFQYLYSSLSAIRQAVTRTPEPRGGVQGHPVLTRFIKQLGPIGVVGIWPFEYQLLDLQSNVINRIYRVTKGQAEAITQLATRAKLRIVVE
jgi:hypothetical protein